MSQKARRGREPRTQAEAVASRATTGDHVGEHADGHASEHAGEHASPDGIRSGETTQRPAELPARQHAEPPEPPEPLEPPARVGIGRIPVLAVAPAVDGGQWPAKAVVGEWVPVTATVFREGHDAVAADAVLIGPDGRSRPPVRMHLLAPGTDRYGADVVPDAEGDWELLVQGWSDPYGTWEHDAVIKVGAGVDVELMMTEGALLLDRALAQGRPEADAEVLQDAVHALRDTGRPAQARLAVATSPRVREVLAREPVRDLVTRSPARPLRVERERALYGSWYEFFPRSEGAHRHPVTGDWVSGTFRTAAQRLPAVAAMGFHVAYLPPIHPIGEVNRKGRNNSVTCEPGDPGSPWAIGSRLGGHDAVHPDLGTLADFDAFVAAARDNNLEVALDFALQCAPDHPWVRDHPEWFTTRADGTIAYAENPPKKYQDIYPLNFDNDPDGLYEEVLRVVEHWIAHGVRIFRVDNPHTKPVQFWEWLIDQVRSRHNGVIFLAEAFTRPAMMHTLAKVGFQQSYTYFTWRNTKLELAEYLTEVSGEAAAYMRPNFFPTTPDILPEFLQYGGPAAFRLRAILAATMVPNWGIYSGYELCEHVARPGAEEFIDNEKYEYRPRDWAVAEAQGRSLAPLLRQLNEIRENHCSLQRLRGTRLHRTDDDAVIAYSRRVTAAQSPDGREDCVLVVANLDPHGPRETLVHLDLPALGLDWTDTFDVHDLLTGTTWRWGERNYVRLDPYREVAHVLHLRRQ